MKLLIDNGHGIETSGKRSPDGVLREFHYNRLIAQGIHTRLTALGHDSTLLVPEESDISLPKRCRRVNEICRSIGKHNVLLLSIHINAAGNGHSWMNARGWCAYTTRGNTRADAFASALYESAQLHLPGMRLRTDYTDGDPDIESDFYILRHTSCPAVLTENLFMDNLDDYNFLLSEEGRQAIVDLHVDGILDYLANCAA